MLSIWADTSEKRIELFVTDYTSHPDLYDHADSESRTSGPYGRRRLQVTMWDSVGEDYKKWEKNKILYLENVQFRPNAMGGIEAAMHANNEWESKIRVALIGKDFGRKLGAGVEEKTRRLGACVLLLLASDQDADVYVQEGKCILVGHRRGSARCRFRRQLPGAADGCGGCSCSRSCSCTCQRRCFSGVIVSLDVLDQDGSAECRPGPGPNRFARPPSFQE